MKNKSVWIVTLLSVIICGLLAVLVYILWLQPKANDAAGTPVSDTTPKVTMNDRTLSSAKGVVIKLNNWPSDNVITNPYTITGEVPGTWSNEGQFTIDGVFEGDIGIPGGIATLQSDWMTEGMVPFTATLDFGPQFKTGSKLTIILHKANPSGIPANDDSLAVDVTIGE